MPFIDSIVPCNVKFHFKCGLSASQYQTSHVKLARERRHRAFWRSVTPILFLTCSPLPVGVCDAKSPDLVLWLGFKWKIKGQSGHLSPAEVGLSQAVTLCGRQRFCSGGSRGPACAAGALFVWPEKLEAQVEDPMFIKWSKAWRPWTWNLSFHFLFLENELHEWQRMPFPKLLCGVRGLTSESFSAKHKNVSALSIWAQLQGQHLVTFLSKRLLRIKAFSL